MNHQKQFFKLLKYDNELKKKKRSLRKDDPELFRVLLKFLVRIETNLNYLEKQEYINLAQDFLEGKVTAEDFSYSFSAIYHGVGEKLSEMERSESLELANLLEPNRSELGDLLANIDGSCDSFSLDPEVAMSDEKELKDCAQLLLLKLQEE